MKARIALAGLWLAIGTTTAFGSPPEPEKARLRDYVFTLASPAFEGRQGKGGERAAAYLVEQFRTLRLEPLFKDSFTQPIPGREPGQVQGRNVGAVLRGTDPALRDEWIIVSAHFDHLGVRDGVLYPGADDNASGVAMMLEVARSLAEMAERPKRSVAFVGFDLEEMGLFGSRYFVEHAPMPIESIALFLTADMLGRSLGGVCDGDVFVMGSEHAPGLRPWIERAAKHQPVRVGMLGTDLLVLSRSDYGPFRARKVPYLFFSTGENPLYHSPRDVPETIQYDKLEAISRVILEVVWTASRAERTPPWTSTPEHPFAEALTVRNVLRTLHENREALKIGAYPLLLITNTLRTLDEIVARGAITPDERSGMIRAARIVMFAVL